MLHIRHQLLSSYFKLVGNLIIDFETLISFWNVNEMCWIDHSRLSIHWWIYKHCWNRYTFKIHRNESNIFSFYRIAMRIYRYLSTYIWFQSRVHYNYLFKGIIYTFEDMICCFDSINKGGIEKVKGQPKKTSLFCIPDKLSHKSKRSRIITTWHMKDI